MKRKIVRLWAEYESDDTVYPVIEPISIATAKEVIDRFLNRKNQYEEMTEKREREYTVYENTPIEE